MLHSPPPKKIPDYCSAQPNGDRLTLGLHTTSQMVNQFKCKYFEQLYSYITQAVRLYTTVQSWQYDIQ